MCTINFSNHANKGPTQTKKFGRRKSQAASGPNREPKNHRSVPEKPDAEFTGKPSDLAQMQCAMKSSCESYLCNPPLSTRCPSSSPSFGYGGPECEYVNSQRSEKQTVSGGHIVLHSTGGLEPVWLLTEGPESTIETTLAPPLTSLFGCLFSRLRDSPKKLFTETCSRTQTSPARQISFAMQAVFVSVGVTAACSSDRR